jgi:hypothetical protein
MDLYNTNTNDFSNGGNITGLSEVIARLDRMNFALQNGNNSGQNNNQDEIVRCVKELREDFMRLNTRIDFIEKRLFPILFAQQQYVPNSVVYTSTGNYGC